MSKIVTTKLGRFRAVTDGTNSWWLWECPHCQSEWAQLSQEQMEGKLSVVHDCGYHETHEFAKELATFIQAISLFGEHPFQEDVEVINGK